MRASLNTLFLTAPPRYPNWRAALKADGLDSYALRFWSDGRPKWVRFAILARGMSH
jgi:hypothetical protein